VNSAVLDASVLLQVAQQERGYERVLPYLPTGQVSSVNLAESVNKLVRAGTPLAVAEEALRPLVWNIVPFTAEHAWEVGMIREQAGKMDLSLGDMACLAVGRCLQLPVLTNDSHWLDADFGVVVQIAKEQKPAG
jgi:PIN domain nuclease of toxin-antitoxin system